MKQNWLDLTAIYMGCTVCLPVILIGQELCRSYGFAEALIAIAVGNGILFVLSLVAGRVGAKERRSTAEQALVTFGTWGGGLFALVMGTAMAAWFAIQLHLMALSLQGIIPLPYKVATVLLGACITYGVRQGVTALVAIARVSMPLLIATLFWALVEAPVPPVDLASEWNGFQGVSLVMAASIALVVDIPTYYRYAASPKDGVIASALLFLVATPVVEGIGVYLSVGAANSNVLEIMQGSGGFFWGLWIALFFLVAGWATNNTNLFSAVACAEAVTPGYSQAMRTYSIGALSTLLACTEMVHHIEWVITCLGIITSSMGGAMLTSHLYGGCAPKTNLFAWSVGTCVGFAAMGEWIILSEIALLDAFAGAAIVTSSMHYAKKTLIKYVT